jgi:hypothetical protein
MPLSMQWQPVSQQQSDFVHPAKSDMEKIKTINVKIFFIFTSLFLKYSLLAYIFIMNYSFQKWISLREMATTPATTSGFASAKKEIDTADKKSEQGKQIQSQAAEAKKQAIAKVVTNADTATPDGVKTITNISNGIVGKNI